MTSQNISLFIGKISGRRVRTGVSFDKSGIISVRNKAYILTVRLFGIEKAVARGYPADGFLAYIRKRKEGFGKIIMMK